MKFAAILMACLAFTAVSSFSVKTGDVKYMDKDMVFKQKFFLEILTKVWEPLMFEEYMTIGNKFVQDEAKYIEFDEDMHYFIELYKIGEFVPRGVTFNVFNKVYLKQAISLFKFFFYAKDFETLQKNICWARMYMNEGMFVYALQMFVMHHEEYKYIVLPTLYEILPFMFYNGRFITYAKDFDLDVFHYEEKMDKEMKDFYHAQKESYLNKYLTKRFDWYHNKFYYVEDKKILRDDVQMAEESKYFDLLKDLNMFWMKADYSDHYEILNEESKLNYLTEDFDWNMFWYYFNMEYPFWMDSKKFDFVDERRGEFWLFTIHQILARYNLERFSHGMNEVEEFSWYTPIKTGYNPQLVSFNGVGFSYRPNYYEIFNSEEYSHITKAEDFERRIRDVVDHGRYVLADGTVFDLTKPESIDEIGLMIMGSVDSLDRKFFGSWLVMYHTLLSYGDEHIFNHGNKYLDIMPHVLLNFETMMRDPLFYMIYNRVYDIFYSFKHRLGHYHHEDLEFKGFKINEITTDKFVTYFDFVDSDVSTLLDRKYFLKDGKFDWNMMLMGRRMRLNNKPFAITYDVESDKTQKVVFRTFLGPKYDEFGREMKFDYSRKFFMELDQFHYDVVSGKNSIKRESEHFFWARKDHTTYTELYKFVMSSFEGKFKFPVDYEMNKMCGFPERLLLPRGWVDGMPMQLFVIVTPFDTTVKEYSVEHHYMNCGEDFDKHPYGFPLDRPINEVKFWVPNMYMKDIKIYHLKDMKMTEDMKVVFGHKFVY